MAERGKYTILTSAVALLRSGITFGPQLSNCWLPASTWVEALRKWGQIDASVVIDVRKFNTAMSKSTSFGEVMSRFDGTNATGVFRIKFQDQFFCFFSDPSNETGSLPKSFKPRVERKSDETS